MNDHVLEFVRCCAVHNAQFECVVRDFKSTSPKGIFGHGTAEFIKDVGDGLMPIQVTFRGDGDGIYPVRTSTCWWHPRDFKWEYLSARERQLVLDEMCLEGAIQ